MSDNNQLQEHFSIEKIKQMRKAGLRKPSNISWSQWNAPFKLKPSHELMCYQSATGLSNVKIAEQMGTTAITVGTVLKSEIGSLRIKELQFEMFGKNPQKRFEGLTHVAIDKIEDILTDPNTRPATKLSACNTILDRGMGKPTQTVEVTTSKLADIFNRLDEVLPSKHVVSDAEYRKIDDAEFRDVQTEDALEMEDSSELSKVNDAIEDFYEDTKD